MYRERLIDEILMLLPVWGQGLWRPELKELGEISLMEVVLRILEEQDTLKY